MRHLTFAAAIPLASVLAFTSPAQVYAQQQTEHASTFLPDKLQWKKGPGSLPEGAQFVVLEGDPSKNDYFALRIRLPGGYRIPPHWHPVTERVTVVSGTFEIGMGPNFDASALRTLPAGSYIALQPRAPHFARAKGETVVQLTSVGPWEINYVDASNDPRKQN